ncbi:baseplate hub protein [Komagataeibacter intermedius]|uniref:baseplate hub protein n=1 Tax=Komagataeibacter intermedius TaxID=66229 RepID=UPI003B431A89
MATQFIRACSLVVGDSLGNTIDLSSLRVRFSITQGTVNTPKTAMIRIWNVSKNTAAIIHTQFNKTVSLSAGYESKSGLIFQGDARQIVFGRENPTDTYLDIQAQANGNAFADATINKTIAAGWTHQGIAQQQAQEMAAYNISLGAFPEVEGSGARPKIMYGMVNDHCRTTAKSVSGVHYTNDDGTLNFVQPAKMTANSSSSGVIELTPSTGLIGIPIQTPNGIQATCLLNPNIKMDSIVHIRAANSDGTSRIQQASVGLSTSDINNGDQTTDNSASNLSTVNGINPTGKYRVIYVAYEGDTRDNPWYTTIVGLSIDPTHTNVAASSTGYT